MDERRYQAGERDKWNEEVRRIAVPIIEEIERRWLGPGVSPGDHRRQHEFLMENQMTVQAMVEYYVKRSAFYERLTNDALMGAAKWILAFVGCAIVYGITPAFKALT